MPVCRFHRCLPSLHPPLPPSFPPSRPPLPFAAAPGRRRGRALPPLARRSLVTAARRSRGLGRGEPRGGSGGEAGGAAAAHPLSTGTPSSLWCLDSPFPNLFCRPVVAEACAGEVGAGSLGCVLLPVVGRRAAPNGAGIAGNAPHPSLRQRWQDGCCAVEKGFTRRVGLYAVSV